MADFQIVEPLNRRKTSGWLGRLITLSIILLVIAVGLYFVALFYQNYLNKSISALNEKIKNLSQEISIEDRNEVLTFYSQLINLKSLLSNHLYPSKIFSRLELITHPQVTFTGFSYDYKNLLLKLEGYAKNLDILAQQILAFQKTTDFTKINLTDIKTMTDKVQFGLEINFTSTFIK